MPHHASGMSDRVREQLGALVPGGETFHRPRMTQKGFRMKRGRQLVLPPAVILIPILSVLARAGGLSRGVDHAWGPLYNAPAQPPAPSRHPPQHGVGPTRWVRHWNEIAINASGLDHTPVAAGENRVFGEQFGPGRSSRAMAI